MSQVALYYAADIHGSERCWRKFLNAARFYQADVLIMGDDVTRKVLVPLVRHNGGWVGRVLGEVRQAETETELEDLKQILRVNGLYPYVCERDEFERMEEDPTYMRQVFSVQMREGLARWIALADEHLRGTGVECYVMPGNDDEFRIGLFAVRRDGRCLNAPVASPTWPCASRVKEVHGCETTLSACRSGWEGSEFSTR